MTTAPSRIDHLIIGAGPTGLGAAWRLATLGRSDWCLCEAGAAFGGLAGSEIDADGFTWDYGGHVQHSHYDYFDALMDDLLGPDGWLSHRRDARIFSHARAVPYPFQLNLHRLPSAIRDECVAGLRAAATARAASPAHFGEWIDASFGAGIARVFMRPYNLKTWATPLDEMSWDWIGDRVATVDLGRVLENIAQERDDTDWGPNGVFRYPLRGGTGAVWRALGDRLQQAHPSSVRLNHRVVEVDTANRVVRFDNGEPLAYGRLLTTMALDELIRSSDLRARLGPTAARLRYTSTHVLGIALHGSPPPAIRGVGWMYFPDAAVPFYRVTVLSNYSPFNVPTSALFWSLLVEISESVDRPRDAGMLVDETLAGLADAGLIASPSHVHHVYRRRLQRGYPVPTIGRDSALAVLLPELEAREVYSRGRFGAWRYEISNQDHSLAQGVELADRWIHGTPERTLRDPAGVNARPASRSILSPAGEASPPG